MRRLSVLALVALFAIGAAACGSSSDGSADTQTTNPASGQQGGSTTSAASETPAGGVTLEVSSSDLGDIVVDQEGRTLYLFTADTGTTTACTGGCASLWPALVAPATAGSDVTGEITEATQADGTTQIALNGHLLYYYGGDTAPGATSGQGIGGNWFVVDPAGDAVKDTASSSPAGGY